MIENNRNNEQIYGRNDMIMLDPNNKIYGSLGLADNYVMKTEEGTRLTLRNPKLGSFANVLTEFNMYGRSEQKQYKGINLFPPNTSYSDFVEVSIPKGSSVFWATDGTPATGGNFRFFNEDKTKSIWLGVDAGSISGIKTLAIDVKYVQNLLSVFDKSKICLGVGNKPIYEPYVGGKPSPSPDYPQEIKSVVNPVIKVRGKNLFDFSRLVSDGVNVIDYDKQTITVPAYTNNTGYNQTLRDLCPGITPGIYVFSVKRSNPDSGNGSYFLEAELDFKFNIPTELTDELLDNHIAWYNNPDSNIENVISEIQIERGTEATDYEPYYEEQTITIPCTLNAIQTESGGNVTINGQQYIADYVDVEKGKLYRKVKRLNLKDADAIRITHGFHSNGNGYLSFRVGNINKEHKPISNRYKSSVYTDKSGYAYSSNDNDIIFVDDRFTDKQTAIKLVQDTYVIYALTSQIETDLTPEGIQEYKNLVTYAGTTIVENNYNTWMKATYKSTESV